MLDLLPERAVSHQSLGEHCSAVLAAAFDDFKWGRDMLLAAGIAAVTVLLQAFWNLIPVADWQNHKWRWILSVTIPFIVVIGVHLLWRLFTSPFKVYRNLADTYETELSTLSAFKSQVENSEVRLNMVRCNHLPNVQRLQRIPQQSSSVRPIGTYEAVTVTFSNPKKAGLPGKIAEKVLARIKYMCSDGRVVEINGRWSQSDQLGSRDPFASTLDLLPMTFHPGDQRDLDIAGKFHSNGLYAYNNDSAMTPCDPNRQLTGSTIRIKIELIAQHVQQTFDFELANPDSGPLHLKPVLPD